MASVISRWRGFYPKFEISSFFSSLLPLLPWLDLLSNKTTESEELEGIRGSQIPLRSE